MSDKLGEPIKTDNPAKTPETADIPAQTEVKGAPPQSDLVRQFMEVFNTLDPEGMELVIKALIQGPRSKK